MSLTEKLISLRKEKGLTQLDLAEQLHVSRQAISRWEVGTAIPSTDNLKILSELYGVPVDYLLHNGAQRPAKPAEFQEEKAEEQPEEVPTKNLSRIIICALGIVLAIVIGIAIWLAAILRQDETRVTPIREMDSIVEDYSSDTFSIG